MLSIDDLEFCCKLFRGPTEVIQTNEDTSIFFNRPYNGPGIISIHPCMCMNQVIEIIKEMNEAIEITRSSLRIPHIDAYIIEEELKYQLRTNKFSIVETVNEYIVSFHLNPNIDRIISKNAKFKDIEILIRSILPIE